MSIKLKLIYAFTFMLFSTFCLGVFSLWKLERVSNLSQETSSYWLPSIQYLSEANFFAAGFRRAEYEHILEKDPVEMDKMKEKMAQRSEKLLAALDKYEAVIKTDEDKQNLKVLRGHWNDYLKDSEAVTSLSKSGRNDEALHHMRNESNVAFLHVTKLLDKVIEHSKEGGKIAGTESVEVFKTSRILIYTLLALLLVIGTVLSIYLIKGIQATIQDTLKQVLQISNEVAKVAENLSEASTELSASTQQQAAAIQQTASSTEEITSMVARTAENASSAKEITGECLTSADTGNHDMEIMTQAIHDISKSNQDIFSQVERSNQDLKNIVTLINEIGTKTKVINDIVFQTKLLSFNASIEAARAGEAGKGFSVVAEEVGNLAAMSGKAAEDISHLLENSVRKVSEVANNTQTKVTSMVSSGKQKIDRGIEIAEKCQVSLKEIVSNSNVSMEKVTEINTASGQQASGVDEIRRAIHELSTGIQQNAETTTSVSNSAHLLKEHTSALNQLVQELSTGKKAS